MHFGRHHTGDTDIEIRGRELKHAILGAEQDIGEDGQRRARADDVLYLLNGLLERLLTDRELQMGRAYVLNVCICFLTSDSVRGKEFGWEKSQNLTFFTLPRANVVANYS
jgi:hypothetical protein